MNIMALSCLPFNLIATNLTKTPLATLKNDLWTNGKTYAAGNDDEKKGGSGIGGEGR